MTRPTASAKDLSSPIRGEDPSITRLVSPSAEGSEELDPWTNRRATEQASRAAQARQVSGRRRLVDPATCERDYDDDEVEFMRAMQEYKKSSGRMFPTWSEVLEVLISLGYRKPEPAVCKGEGGRAGEAPQPKMARA